MLYLNGTQVLIEYTAVRDWEAEKQEKRLMKIRQKMIKGKKISESDRKLYESYVKSEMEEARETEFQAKKEQFTREKMMEYEFLKEQWDKTHGIKDEHAYEE